MAELWRVRNASQFGVCFEILNPLFCFVGVNDCDLEKHGRDNRIIESDPKRNPISRDFIFTVADVCFGCVSSFGFKRSRREKDCSPCSSPDDMIMLWEIFFDVNMTESKILYLCRCTVFLSHQLSLIRMIDWAADRSWCSEWKPRLRLWSLKRWWDVLLSLTSL